MFFKVPVALLFPFCAAALLLSSCESQPPATTPPAATSAAPAATAPAAASPATTPVAEARYECPMQCANSQSSEPGKCPVCAMDLVKKT